MGLVEGLQLKTVISPSSEYLNSQWSLIKNKKEKKESDQIEKTAEWQTAMDHVLEAK